MSRYIDVDALKKSIDDCDICNICPDKDVRCDYDCDFPDCLTPKWETLINSAPSIDIEPKCGKNLKSDYPSLFECSVCGASCDDTIPWDCDINFCPNCGADMKGADDE